MAERDGFAVQCKACKGAGESTLHVDYDDFDGRLPRQGVFRVLECNPGICAGGTSNFGGMPYADWASGLPFPPGSEMREFTCPAWWYQSANYAKRPDWDECKENMGWSFSKCRCFNNKAACWARWDKEHLND